MIAEGANLFQKVVDVLADDMGATSAKASVAMFLRRSGIEPENLEPEHLADLAKKLEPGLRVFVGGATAKLLAKRVSMLG